MNRITVVAMLVAFGSLGRAQDLSSKISVEIPASRAAVAFPLLSKAAGVTLEPAGNLRDQVFVINAHDATVDEVMKRIAQAEGGQWVHQTNGSYLLVRDNATSVLQERAELKGRTDAVRAAVAKLNQSLQSQPKFDQAAAQRLAEETHKTLDGMMQGGGPRPRIDIGAIPTKTPAARAIARLLASIDPAKLAQIAMNQRVVFSTNPTNVQASLTGQGYAAFRDFIAEQQLYTKAYTATQAQETGVSRMVFFNGFGTPTMGSGDPSLGLGVGLVIVQRRYEGGLDVQVIASDTKLDTLASGSYQLRFESPVTTPPAAGKEDPIELSADSKEMAKALGSHEGGPAAVKGRVSYVVSSDGGGFSVSSSSNGSGHIKLSPGLRAKVLNPDKYDPLSFVPSEAMVALAHHAQKNLVALLPDTCFGSLTQAFAKNVTPTQLWNSLGKDHSLAASEDGDWMIVTPMYPASARFNTIDRFALKSLLQNMDRNRGIRLDDAAAFALAENKVPGMNDFDILYPQMIDDGATAHDLMPLAMGSFSTYKFYGSLSPNQRAAVASGRQMNFANLSPQQLALIADMLYNSQQPPSVQMPNPQQPGRPGTTSTTSMVFATAIQSGKGGMPVFFGGGGSAQTERTIVVPTGVPNDGYLVGTVTSQDVVKGINSQTGDNSILDASSLAFQKAYANDPNMGFANANYDKYKMQRESRLNITFFFNPRVNLSRSLSDVSGDPNAQEVGYDALPTDFRNRVDQVSQELQKAMQKMPGKQGTPPPQ